jgi:hypothetical protein
LQVLRIFSSSLDIAVIFFSKGQMQLANIKTVEPAAILMMLLLNGDFQNFKSNYS